MNILIEGWRGINHSFSLVNQWQILELSKSCDIFFNDVPFASEKWNKKKNFSGLEKNLLNFINNIPNSQKNQMHDITYRISFPFNFNNKFNSKILFVFGNCAHKDLPERNYINGIPEKLKNNKDFFIHTPSNWCKEGYLNAGFKDNQIVVIPHGVNEKTFHIVSEEERIRIRKKYGIEKDAFILTNIGAMTENKGVEILIAAYGILKKKIDNLKLILKDQSNLFEIKTDYLFNKLKKSKFNKKYNIINERMMRDIKIISKNLNLQDINNLYSITDCYVSPYRAEGFNLTPLEAAACGSQIIITKGGCTDDYYSPCLGFQIESSEKKINNKYFLNPSLDSLVNILEDKVINKPDASKIERSNYVIKNFSWDKVVSKLKEEFRNKLK